MNSNLLRNADVKSWDVIFKALMDATFASKPVIVIDEFQYIGKSNPAFPSIFQRIWEEILKAKQVMVILCGSLISMMESQTLSYKQSPLWEAYRSDSLNPNPFSVLWGVLPPQKPPGID